MNSAERIIAKFGGIKPMARKLGHRFASRVQGWKERGVIPVRAWPEVMAAAQANGIALAQSEFMPDAESAPAAVPAVTLDPVIADLIAAGVLPAVPLAGAPRTFIRSGNSWRSLPDTEAPPMDDSPIVRVEWIAGKWQITFDSHSPVSGEAA